MRFELGPDEWYPVLVLRNVDEDTSPDDIIELTDEEVATAKRLQEEFVAFQKLLKERTRLPRVRHANCWLIKIDDD